MMNLLTESAASAGGGIALMVIYIVTLVLRCTFFRNPSSEEGTEENDRDAFALEIGEIPL